MDDSHLMFFFVFCELLLLWGGEYTCMTEVFGFSEYFELVNRFGVFMNH